MVTNVSTTIFQNAAGTPALNLLNGDTLNLLPTGFILATGAGASPGVQAAGSNVFNLAGTIISTQHFGIELAAGGNNFNIGSPATIFGQINGLRINGAGGNTISNAGDIGSVGTSVLVLGNSNTFSNSGNIISTGNDALDFQSGSNTVTNSGYISGTGGDGLQIFGANNNVFNTGTLIGGVCAVDFDGNLGIDALFNAGTMIGTNVFGYDGSNAQDFITNNGLIQGGMAAVDLAGGNDVYDGRNGTLVGAVQGGSGDDIIFGGVGGENINGGNDNDHISGGGGGDVIIGGAGNDLILGGAGGDVIQGGLGVDLFGFNVGDNGDLIQAFNESGVRDGFDLRGYFNVTGFTGTNPRAAGIMQVLQNGADTDVYLHGAFAFRIQGVVAAAIDDTYFLFQ